MHRLSLLRPPEYIQSDSVFDDDVSTTAFYRLQFIFALTVFFFALYGSLN